MGEIGKQSERDKKYYIKHVPAQKFYKFIQ